MRRYRLLMGVCMLALLGLADWLLMAHLRQPQPGITKENFDRIEKGMTAKEVEAILGPPGRHTTRPIDFPPMEGTSFRRWWVGDDGVITISFGPADWTSASRPFMTWLVREKALDESPPEPFLDRLRRLLPW